MTLIERLCDWAQTTTRECITVQDLCNEAADALLHYADCPAAGGATSDWDAKAREIAEVLVQYMQYAVEEEGYKTDDAVEWVAQKIAAALRSARAAGMSERDDGALVRAFGAVIDYIDMQETMFDGTDNIEGASRMRDLGDRLRIIRGARLASAPPDPKDTPRG